MREGVKKRIVRLCPVVWIFAAAFVTVTLCSRSSFLYPMNTWCDANCFFTVAKSMANGKVLYRDIYEQKGLYLYALYLPAYLLSHDSFIGAYILEVVFATVFAFTLYKTMTLYIAQKSALVLVPVLLAVSFSPYSFANGGSAEEFFLPVLAIPLYLLMRSMRTGRAMRLWHYALAGGGTAFALWVKFTLVGFFVGWLIVAFVWECKHSGVKRAFAGVGLMAAGFAVASLPAILYFARYRALGDMFRAYFYNNIFLYSNEKAGQSASLIKKVWYIFRSYFASFGFGWPYYLCIVPGFFYFAASRKFSRWEKVALFTTYGATELFTFAGGVGYFYYGLPACAYAFTGGVALCMRGKGDSVLTDLHGNLAATAAVFCTLSVLLMTIVSINVPMIGAKKEDLMQYKFAAIVNETPDATLLNYGALDVGLYTAANILPTCKYFCGLNIPLPDIAETQDEWVRQGRTDYVVTLRNIPPDIELHYTLLGEADGYRLYGLKEKRT